MACGCGSSGAVTVRHLLLQGSVVNLRHRLVDCDTALYCSKRCRQLTAPEVSHACRGALRCYDHGVHGHSRVPRLQCAGDKVQQAARSKVGREGLFTSKGAGLWEETRPTCVGVVAVQGLLQGCRSLEQTCLTRSRGVSGEGLPQPKDIGFQFPIKCARARALSLSLCPFLLLSLSPPPLRTVFDW